MLELSNTLNTSNSQIYSKKVKDVTMNNEQVALYNQYGHLRDYTGIGTLLRNFLDGCLRYSPLFCEGMKLGHKFSNIFIYVCKLLKRELEFFISRRLAYYSTSTSTDTVHFGDSKKGEDKLDPNWVTGFVDAEGCFSVIIEIPEGPASPVPSAKKWKVRISFEINLHEKDKDILYKIQSFFGVGAVYHRPDRKKSVYRVTNVTYIKNVIIPHFANYPLVSKKGIDFLLWSKVVEIILNKDHLTKEGFLKILSYYASINKGVSKKVVNIYPNIIPSDKPIIGLPVNLNPQWVSGFTAGDGGFSIYVRPAKDYVLGEKVYCRFHIAQHSKDFELMKLFIKFFGCGKVDVRSNISTPRCDYIVQDTSSLVEKIISHFDLYPVLNLKDQDFLCFRKALFLIKEKKHLTKEGLDKIKSLNLEMNSNRLK